MYRTVYVLQNESIFKAKEDRKYFLMLWKQGKKISDLLGELLNLNLFQTTNRTFHSYDNIMFSRTLKEFMFLISHSYI